jgi:hypothetical protein
VLHLAQDAPDQPRKNGQNRQRADYNVVKPHSSLDQMPPADLAAAHRETAA